MCLCSMRLRSPEEGVRSMELELKTVMSCHLGAGNQTRLLLITEVVSHIAQVSLELTK